MLDRSQDRLKSLFSKGRFDDEFIEESKVALPRLWGRLNLLEEFFKIESPGHEKRSRQIRDQLGTPREFHGSSLRKLISVLFG
jgi:hypothetical protein